MTVILTLKRLGVAWDIQQVLTSETSNKYITPLYTHTSHTRTYTNAHAHTHMHTRTHALTHACMHTKKYQTIPRLFLLPYVKGLPGEVSFDDRGRRTSKGWPAAQKQEVNFLQNLPKEHSSISILIFAKSESCWSFKVHNCNTISSHTCVDGSWLGVIYNCIHLRRVFGWKSTVSWQEAIGMWSARREEGEAPGKGTGERGRNRQTSGQEDRVSQSHVLWQRGSCKLFLWTGEQISVRVESPAAVVKKLRGQFVNHLVKHSEYQGGFRNILQNPAGVYEWRTRGWREGSVVQSTGFSSRGPWLDSQNPHGG